MNHLYFFASRIAIIFLSLFIPLLTFCQSWNTYPYIPANSLITFPKDEGSHNKEPIEWWYTVGHVIGVTTGTNYSYMLTYFRYPTAGFGGFRILNISNDNTGQFYSETLPVNYSLLAADSLNIKANVFNRGTETWSNKVDVQSKAIPFQYTLAASAANGSLQLEYKSEKKPLILADSGFFYQGKSSYTYYFSQTKIAVTGKITFKGFTETVTGTSWIDRQYGTFNPYSGEKYEWFNIQLSNGMDMNLINIFSAENKIFNTLNYNTLAVYQDSINQYTTADFTVERLGYRYAADKATCYSKQWRLTSEKNKIDLLIDAPMADYEVRFPFRFYEGPTFITGTVNGEAVSGLGFAELLHHYENPRVTFTNPSPTASLPLSWKINNPDQGRPLKYDLEVSLDNKNFDPIAQGLVDTFYYWSNKPSRNYFLRLKAYSLDTTLVTDTTVVIDPVITSTNNYFYTTKALLAPSPFSMYCTFIHPETGKIRIFNHQGILIEEQEYLSKTELHLGSSWPKGLYIINFVSEVEKRVFKILKD